MEGNMWRALLLAVVVAVVPGIRTAFADTLFIGTDARSFNNVLPDQLGVATVSGATFVSQTT
jgi:hypothetical protein